MRRLFWRIFAMFWLATFVLIVAIAWSTSYTFENETVPGLAITRLESVLNEQLRGAGRAMRDGGVAALGPVVAGARQRGITMYLLDDDQHDVLGREVPPAVTDAVTHAVADMQG